jgi:hypothetical protein
MKELMAEGKISDFCILRSSLEQVFKRIVRGDIETTLINVAVTDSETSF